jgi:hypothetical protein
MRLGDASRRVVGDFDLENATLTFLPEKKQRTDRSSTLPRHPAAHQIVAKLAEKRGGKKPS